jgi:hypothetical protein
MVRAIFYLYHWLKITALVNPSRLNSDYFFLRKTKKTKVPKLAMTQKTAVLII